MQGTVFNIQRYTIHDGPGIRTELFLKGCPLSCKWCGNPESRLLAAQPGVYSSRCIGKEKCGICIEACGQDGGLIFGKGKGLMESDELQHECLISINRNLCMGCMKCAEICPADAIKQWGRDMDEDEVMELIRRDISYYQSSGGGITISGGEPLMQADFTKTILRRCQEEGIHTCLESTFCVEWEIIEKIIPYADMFITDIKHMDDGIHKKYTGASNKKILENLRRLSEVKKPIIIRIPVIPDINDDMDNIVATANFIWEDMCGKIQTLQLLPFMRLGEEKYQSLGISYPMEDLIFDREAFQKHIHEMAVYFNGRGIRCQIGTKEKA